jgi:integrase
MGVKIRKRGGKWYVFVDYQGRRKAKCIGSNRATAEQVKRAIEAKLALGDFEVFGNDEAKAPTFATYADQGMRDYARVECKTSTAHGYEGVLRQYLRPQFALKRALTKLTAVTSRP